MNRELQRRAPIVEALEQLRSMRVVPFDVPGHKRGKGNPELTAFLGERCLSVDVNSMRPLDNLGHPVSVIREAEELAADAFGASHAFFIVNGATAAVQAMLLHTLRAGDTVLLPRNVHKSVINALILSGATPAYVDTPVHPTLHIALGMRVQDVEAAIKRYPDAKAVFVNNPTYYGICSDLAAIVRIAHSHGMLVLADEAHGAHFYFGENLPLSAMGAGADLSAVSMHKSGGSLTQSSFLLSGAAVDPEALRQTINLTQTTSASYLLLASLDLSRKSLALNGGAIFSHVAGMANYAREEINKTGAYYAYCRELIDGGAVHDFDVTKLAVATGGVGLTGVEVYDILRDEYDIQAEFGDTSNLLAYVSVGDRPREIERLVGALAEIARRFRRPPAALPAYPMPKARVRMSPREAYYRQQESLPILESRGRVSGAIIMAYPPGIPILAPGEEVTDEAIAYIRFAQERGCLLSGLQGADAGRICVVQE